MRRVAAVVLNSVSHDARVLKEADSLSRAGYEVTVFGIQDNRCDEATTIRPSGVVIRRVNWKLTFWLVQARLMLSLGLVVTGLLVSGFLVFSDAILEFITGPLFFRAAGVVVALMAMVPFYRKYRQNWRRIRHSRGRPKSAELKSKMRLWFARFVTRGVMQRVLTHAVAELEPAAVHCHDLQTLPIGHAIKKKTGCSIVYDSHELYEDLSLISPRTRFTSRLRQRYYSGKVDALVTINDSIATTLRQRYPRLPEPVIVRNATTLLTESIAYDGRLHDAAGVARTAKILLYQGGYARFRGLESLVRSAPLMPDGWCIVMMGWGALESELRSIAAQVDREAAHVRFIPAAPQAELMQWTAGASLGIIPYDNVCLNHWLCTPNKLWEYPAAGVPILVSPFPEMRKVVESHGIGLLLSDPATAQNIAEKVDSLTDEQLVQMSQRCQEFIQQDHWGVYETRLIELYAGLLGGGPAPAQPVSEVDRPRTVVEPVTERRVDTSHATRTGDGAIHGLRWTS